MNSRNYKRIKSGAKRGTSLSQAYSRTARSPPWRAHRAGGVDPTHKGVGLGPLIRPLCQSRQALSQINDPGTRPLYKMASGLSSDDQLDAGPIHGGTMSNLLNGRRILIVEDNYLLAVHLSNLVENFGGLVIGPAGQLAQGSALAESEELDAAILNINLGEENS